MSNPVETYCHRHARDTDNLMPASGFIEAQIYI